MRCCCLGVILLCSVGNAHADDEARRSYQDGEAAYSAGRYDAAARAFERSYELSHAVPLLWNIAQSYRHQFDIDQDPRELRRARAVFVNYRSLKPDSQGEADAAIREVDEQLAKLAANPAPPPTTATPATRPAPILTAPPPDTHAPVADNQVVAAPAERPLARRPWFIATMIGVAAVVIAAVAVGVVVGAAHDPSPSWGAVAGN